MPEIPPFRLSPARELVFDFDLHQSPNRFYDRECRKLLLDAFPGAHAIEFDDRLLVYRFSQLPPKPWPKKIAGVPCYFTDHDNDLGPTVSLIRRRDFPRTRLAQHLDLRDNEAAADLVFNLVKDFFKQRAIPITEIQFWGRLVIIILEGKEDRSIFGTGRLPQSGARCNCFYLFDEEMSRPGSLSAFQHQENVEFRNKPLENTVIPGPPSKFNELSQAPETKLGDSIFLDTPFSGFLEGTTVCHAVFGVPTSDDPGATQQSTWIRCQWHYMGEGSGQAISDKICGSPIWNKEHKVQGLFRYAPTSGVFVDFCMSVAADELLSEATQ
ncbi:hypothetical protein BJX68DRAFT_237826 [Aspergillus pseudodeflectus]|uniref:Uncharacterized protein n=1 Tax=Aspergillus pseudodeflectus TaxID=176178 RepID=A0ABR4KAJ5_9EURO